MIFLFTAIEAETKNPGTARGSLPVSWAINPMLAEQFPALWDYFAATATANDSFVAGVGGGGE